MCTPIARCRPITLYQPVVAGIPLSHPIRVCELHDVRWPCAEAAQAAREAFVARLKRARAQQRNNLFYTGEHCSTCGAYVGLNRWCEAPEYGSHGCLWSSDARVLIFVPGESEGI